MDNGQTSLEAAKPEITEETYLKMLTHAQALLALLNGVSIETTTLDASVPLYLARANASVNNLLGNLSAVAEEKGWPTNRISEESPGFIEDRIQY